MNNEISMSIKPEWDKIREVRIRTENFLKSQNLKDNVIDAIIMNTCELLENAVKYGSFINNTTGITASISISDSDIIVEVKSPVKDENDLHFRKLDRLVSWIRGYKNPFEAYTDKIKEIARQSVSDDQSGLGIVRIAYEGKSDVGFFVNENVISVSAVYHISEPGRCIHAADQFSM